METTKTTMNISIRYAGMSQPAPLYCQYYGQTEAQGARVCLDVETGDLWAEYDPEIGHVIPMRYWLEMIRCWPVTYAMSATRVNDLLDHIAPLATRVLNGATVRWFEDTPAGFLDSDARDASKEIRRICADTVGDLRIWDARRDWGETTRSRDLRDAEAAVGKNREAMTKWLSERLEVAIPAGYYVPDLPNTIADAVYEYLADTV